MSNYVKPQSPIYNNKTDTYIYPLTTADQVIMPDGSRFTNIGVIQKNYSVVGGLEEPSNPTQNMIWVQTETTIGRVFFSNDEPNEAFADGDVWIATGDSSKATFNALKIDNNYINEIYPLLAKQYINGAWINKIAKSYQNKEWVNWILWIIENGFANKFSTSVRDGYTASIVQNDGYLKIGGTSASIPVSTDELIDISNYSTIEFDVNVLSSYSNSSYTKINGCSIFLLPKNNYSDLAAINNAVIAFVNTVTTGRQTLILDVSDINDEYYIAINVCSGESTLGKIDVYNLVLK